MAKANTKDVLSYARSMLDKLRDLDQLVHGAYYDMGRILSAIAHGQLYDVLGYTGLSHLIEEELSFSPSQGYRYLHTYRHFRRVGYSKTEALDLIGEYSWSHMADVLPSMSSKVGKRAVGNAVEKLLSERRQINFTVNEADHAVLMRALEKFGAEQKPGRLMHSSEALVAIARHVTS